MADAFAAIDEPRDAAVDKRVDAESRIVNGVEVLLQRIRLAGDGNTYAEVDAEGNLQVEDAQLAGVRTDLGLILAQLDDDTADTVVSVLKAIFTELQSKADLGETQPVSVQSFPSTYALPTAQLTSLAQQATLAAVLAELESIDAGLAGGATEATLATLATEATAATLATEATAQTLATESTLDDVKRALTDYETRLDYDARTDGNPVYVGKAPQGTLTATASWTIQRLGYDASNRLTRVQVLTGSWDNRASLGWT